LFVAVVAHDQAVEGEFAYRGKLTGVVNADPAISRDREETARLVVRKR